MSFLLLRSRGVVVLKRMRKWASGVDDVSVSEMRVWRLMVLFFVEGRDVFGGAVAAFSL